MVFNPLSETLSLLCLHNRSLELLTLHCNLLRKALFPIYTPFSPPTLTADQLPPFSLFELGLSGDLSPAPLLSLLLCPGSIFLSSLVSLRTKIHIDSPPSLRLHQRFSPLAVLLDDSPPYRTPKMIYLLEPFCGSLSRQILSPSSCRDSSLFVS